MGRISNWLVNACTTLTEAFTNSALLSLPSLDVPLHTLHNAVSHIPLEASHNFDMKDAVAERWLKLSMMMTDPPQTHENTDHVNKMGQLLYDIGMDILGSEKENVRIPKSSIDFLNDNMQLFVVAQRGYKRAEQDIFTNLYAIREPYRTTSSLIDECPKRFKEMIERISKDKSQPDTTQPQKPVQFKSVGMPRPGRN